MPGISPGWHRRARCADVLPKGKQVCMPVESGLQGTIPADQLELGIHRVEVDVDRRPSAALLDRQAVHPAEVHEHICLSYKGVHASCAWAILDAMFHINENPARAKSQPVKEPGRRRETVLIGRIE